MSTRGSPIEIPVDGQRIPGTLVMPATAVPGFLFVQGWGSGQNLNVSSEELAGSPEVRDLMQGYIDQANGKLERWETVKRFAILTSEFTVDEGEVTPSQKIRRRAVEKHYANQLDALYDKD